MRNLEEFLFIYFLNRNLFILVGGQLPYNIVLDLPYINMNLPQVYTCSPYWTSPPTSLPVPSLWVISVHQPQASSIMHRTWTGYSFYIWYYTCFNAILPNHPTLALSHRVQKTVLYTSVSLLLSRKQGYHYHLSKFHIYALVYCIGGFFLAYFTLYNRLQFHPLH